MGKGYLSPGRLQDVLALIQILGLGEDATLAPNGICRAIQDLPPGEKPSEERERHWKLVAMEHREFFRVAGTSSSISLYHRFHTPGKKALDPSVVHKLMETAVNIHDREIRRRDRWMATIPLIVAVLGLLGSSIVALIGWARSGHLG